MYNSNKYGFEVAEHIIVNKDLQVTQNFTFNSPADIDKVADLTVERFNNILYYVQSIRVKNIWFQNERLLRRWQKLINVINNNTDPCYNLAFEEYFLKDSNLNDNLLILWRNEPVIVVGRNQNAHEELNLEYVRQNGIKVVRRLSGGGAVYHDLGNLNFTIILKGYYKAKNDFSFFTKPIVSCLNKLGVKAEFNGRNDIIIDGKKFSGNAQYFDKDRILHHGTLLFASNLAVLSKALNVKPNKFESKGVQSVRSRVTNISDYLKYNISILDFKDILLKSIFEDRGEECKNYTPTEEDIVKIKELVDKKYGTWEWNYGSFPKFNYKREMKFDAGNISLNLNLYNSIIKGCYIFGDFFENNPIEELEKAFIGKRYDYDELNGLIMSIDISHYIHGISSSDFFKLLFC